MPDTLTPQELATIRGRDADVDHDDEQWVGYTSADQDRHALLAHLDALTAAVEALEGSWPAGDYVPRAAVLAILKGEQ